MTYAIVINDKRVARYTSNWDFPIGKKVQLPNGEWATLTQMFENERSLNAAWNLLVKRHNALMREKRRIENLEIWREIASKITKGSARLTENDVLQAARDLGCI